MATLEGVFRNTKEEVCIQTQHNADLFNVCHFKTNAKIEHIPVQDTLLANNSAMVAHTDEEIQMLIDRFKIPAKISVLQ